MLLVTGITGHSGKYFLQELIDNKYEGSIRCIVRETSDTSMLDHSGLHIEKVVGDLGDQEFVNEAMLDVDTVFHIGSIFYSVTVMKAAIKNKVKRAVFVHTTGIYSNYKSASSEYKEIETTIKALIDENHSPIDLTYLRPTMIYGYTNDRNMIVFIKMVDKLRLFPIINHGKNLLQPVNGRDLGKAYYQLLSHPNITNGDYILSGDKPISMLDMFKTISRYLHKKTLFINVPVSVGVFKAKCLRLVTFHKIDFVERVQRMGEDRHFPHDAATKDFDYKPMPFDEGLKIEIEQYLKSKDK